MADIDKTGAEWRHIETWARDQIRLATARIITQNVGATETEFHRGRIAALNELLRLPDTGTGIIPPPSVPYA